MEGEKGRRGEKTGDACDKRRGEDQRWEIRGKAMSTVSKGGVNKRKEETGIKCM